MVSKINFLFSKLKRVKEIIKINLDFRRRSKELLNITLTTTDSLISKEKYKTRDLIVSLTTYSKRIHDIHLVIESIGQQTIKPNQLILWLDENEFTIDTIPFLLKKQVNRGLDIRFCPNYRSYKKLVPTLNLFPDADIITIDDDILYPFDMVEGLVKENKLYSNCVIAHVLHKIKIDESNWPLPYSEWQFSIKDTEPSILNMAVGVGGVYYPNGSLPKECLDIDSFTTLAPHADDIWFKAMTLLNGFQVKKVNDSRAFSNRFLSIKSSQDIGLYIGNLLESRNDEQISKVFKKYKLHEYL